MKPPTVEFITIGEILAPWGTRGKIRVQVATDLPQRFAPSAKVYIGRHPMTVVSTKWHKGKAIIKLDGIDDYEAAHQLRGHAIEIHHTQAHPLPEGEFYHFQLIGMEVWTTQGELVGSISEVLSGESNDSYVVSRNSGEVLIPAIDDVVKSVDTDEGRVTIEAIDGLLS